MATINVTERKPHPDLHGILLVDKPKGPTSHDIVDRIRRVAHMRRVGHTGTLDRLATGLLIICLGKATRLSEYLTRMDKIYEGYMRLGLETDSYDMDGEVIEEKPVPPVTTDHLQELFDEFTGEIQQVPPMISAVKVGGRRLYKMAREGQTVARQPRQVTVHSFELLDYEEPLAHFRISCSSGTYVRALCHDIGQRLGCGATLDSLRRVAVGKHHVQDAATVDELRTPEDVAARLVPMSKALDLPEAILSDAGMGIVAVGGAIRGKDLKTDCPIQHGLLQLKSEADELVALAHVESGPVGLRIAPKRVFLRSGGDAE